jgi:hypothetical protein
MSGVSPETYRNYLRRGEGLCSLKSNGCGYYEFYLSNPLFIGKCLILDGY